MQRLLLFAMALVLCTGPSFAQSADLAQPGTTSSDKIDRGTASASTQSLALLFDNGPIQTGTGNGAGGGNTSAIGAYGSTNFGFGHNATIPAYVADDFVVPAGGWTLSDLQFLSYQTGGNATTTSITGLFVQIWNGRPGDAGSAVVFGDLTTNRLATSVFSGIYRVTSTTLTGATRPVYRNTATVNTVLAPGTYWVQWGTTGSLASGPWAPHVTTNDATPPPGNARQFTAGAWATALDGGDGTPGNPGTITVAFPFIVNGTAGTPTGPTLSAAPSAVAFGTVTAGTTSAPRTVTLTNGGTATTTITSITGSGAPFTVSTTGTSLSLAPGASTTFSVTFAPTTGATSTGSVSIVSNAPGSPLAIALTGTGNADVTSTIPPGTTIGGSIWARPTVLGTGATGNSCTVATTANGSAVAYRTRQFTIATAGNYTITTNYTGNSPVYDGWINLYRTTFNPADPCLNHIAFDDDFGTPPLENSQIAATPLTAGTYVLVITGYANVDAGTFTGTIVGAGAAIFAVAGEGTASNGRASLSAAPNPFQGTATVRFTTATAQDVTVSVYDVTGRQVATLFAGAVAADQEVAASLDGAQLPAGVYVIRATGADLNLTQRVTVVR